MIPTIEASLRELFMYGRQESCSNSGNRESAFQEGHATRSAILSALGLLAIGLVSLIDLTSLLG
jgi:hypothetical protein